MKEISVFYSDGSTSDGILGKTVNHVLMTLGVSIRKCDDHSTADVVFIYGHDENRSLIKYYSRDQSFVILSLLADKPADLPENVEWVHFVNAVVELTKFFSEFQPDHNRLKRCIELEPEVATEDSLHLLIVDDKIKNLKRAVEKLGNKHFLTLTDGYDEALRMIKNNSYAAVLSDCQMPVGTEKSSLAGDVMNIGETVHNGLFLMFYATSRGSRFAIVTDANHHKDWVSAIFDDLREPQNVNNQPVLFINYIQKNWDKALEKLMSL